MVPDYTPRLPQRNFVRAGIIALAQSHKPAPGRSAYHIGLPGTPEKTHIALLFTSHDLPDRGEVA